MRLVSFEAVPAQQSAQFALVIEAAMMPFLLRHVGADAIEVGGRDGTDRVAALPFEIVNLLLADPNLRARLHAYLAVTSRELECPSIEDDVDDPRTVKGKA